MSEVPGMEPREVTLHGHRLSYRSGGSGPVLVLIHGITGSAATWDDVLPWLAERHTVVAPGLCRPPPRTPAPRRFGAQTASSHPAPSHPPAAPPPGPTPPGYAQCL